MKIAIDGPSASGKTAVGSAVARALGLRFLDTGLTYRAVGLRAQRAGANLDNAGAVGEIASGLQLVDERGVNGDLVRIGVAGFARDELLDDALSDGASRVAQHRAVRETLVGLQRATARDTQIGIVMVGRDIGTVVLRDIADLKVYLNASPETRAKRRSVQHSQPYDSTADELKQRDGRDTGRAISPLEPAKDAVIVETDDLSVTQVSEHILKLIGQKTNKAAV